MKPTNQPPKKRKGFISRLFKPKDKRPEPTLDIDPPSTHPRLIDSPEAAELPNSAQNPAGKAITASIPPHSNALVQDKPADDLPALPTPEPKPIPKEQPKLGSLLKPQTNTLPSISELWDEAYDELAKDKSTSKMITEYQSVLSGNSGVGKVSRDKGERREQMARIANEKKQEIEDGKWKKEFLGREFAVKDLVKPVVSTVEWAKDYVGTAVAASPPASLAWAGVCLLLPLILTPSHQDAARVLGLEKIASIVRECSIREAVYHSRYESTSSTTSEKTQATSTLPHTEYRKTFRNLYMQIITFQATYICFLSGNTAKQWVQDATKWQDWDQMVADISKRNDELKSIEELWQHFSLQEEWMVRRKQHEENLEQLKALETEMKRFYDLVATAQKDQERREILDWLHKVKPSFYYDAAIEKRGISSTRSWILDDDDFMDWKREPNSFLWVHGKAGAGKSILSSTAIENLEESYKEDPFTAVAYFYISFKDKETWTRTNLTKSLIAQLFGCRPDRPKSLLDLRKYQDKGRDPPQRELQDALRLASRDFTRTYFIIDGLDECPNAEDDEETGEEGLTKDRRGKLLELLQIIRGWDLDNLHMLMTSRLEYDIEASIKDLQSPRARVIDLGTASYSSKVSDDISLFIDHELKGAKFDKLPDHLKKKIREKLIEKADGVFHYVSLQLSSFRRPITVKLVDDTLASLPKGLYATYDRAFSQLRANQRQLAIRILTWVAFSPIPLTITELAEAALIDLTTDADASSDVDHQVEVYKADYTTPLINEDEKFADPLDVLYLLPGLLDIQTKSASKDWSHKETLQVVVLTHFTLLQYLTSKEIKTRPSSGFALNRTTAPIQLAEACLRYHIYSSQSGRAKDRDSLPLKLPLCTYAARYGLRQAENIGQANWPTSLRQLVRLVLSGESKSFKQLKQLTQYPSPRAEEPPLHYVVEERFSEIMTFLLTNKLADPNATGDCLVGTAMNHACLIQFLEGMKILLGAGADVCLGNEEFPCALDIAIRCNRDGALDFLLQIPDLLSRCQKIDYWPLAMAVRGGTDSERDHAVIEKLLSHGADPNGFRSGGLPAIHLAVVWRRLDALKQLITHHANVQIRDPYFGNALQCAVALGCEDEIRVLLSAGAKLDFPNQDWKSLLDTVAKGSFFEGMTGPEAASRLELGQTLFGAASRSKKFTSGNITLFIDWIEGPLNNYVSVRSDILLGGQITKDIPDWYIQTYGITRSSPPCSGPFNSAPPPL